LVINRPTTVSKSGTIHLPVIDNRAPKVIINVDDNDGVTHTVCDTVTGSSANNWCISCKITRPVTSKLGNFSIRLANTEGKWLESFDGGETVAIYADYVDGTTRMFTGKIDNAKYGVDANTGFYVELDGRDYPEFVDKTMTNLHAAALVSEAIGDIFNQDYTDMTLVFWNGSVWAEATYDSESETITWSDTVTTFPTVRVNMQYQHKKGLSIISEMLDRGGLGGYVWWDGSKWTLRTFLTDTIENLDANVAYGINLISAGEYGFENTSVFNRTFVYGKMESDNIILLKMEEDTSSQSDLWIKDLIVSAPELSTVTEVEEKAEFEIDKNSTQTNTGRFNIIGTPEVNPGEQIAVGMPYCNCSGLHTVTQVSHNIGKTFTTTVEVSKNLQTVAQVFKQKANPDDFDQGTTNLNSMTDSYTAFFDDIEEGVAYSDTEVVDGKLKLSSGKITGNAVSATKTLDYNVRKCELRRFSNSETDDDEYFVTNDGGSTWEEFDFTTGLAHNFATAGNNIAWKINMERYSSTSTSPSYDAFCMLVKA